MGMVDIGVIGAGHAGTNHLRKYERIDNCRIVGVADIREHRAKRAAQDYGCHACRDHRDLIGKVDAVSIAVPAECHHGVAKDFLYAGIDVLLEKPMTRTLGEADELIRAASKNGALLQIGFIERFNPAIEALQKIIETPLFIEVHRLHPFCRRGTDVDVILDLMIHDLDIILHFAKYPPSRVEATGVAVLSDKIDIANARITFENGCIANLTASRVTNKTMQKIRFFGPEGYHSVDYGERELFSLARKIKKNGSVEIRGNKVEVRKYDPLEAEIRAFIDAVITRKMPVVTVYDGKRALGLALRIEKETQEAFSRLS